jgi:hypothetical protein
MSSFNLQLPKDKDLSSNFHPQAVGDSDNDEIQSAQNWIIEGYRLPVQDRINIEREKVSRMDRKRAIYSREKVLSKLMLIFTVLIAINLLIVFLSGFRLFGFSIDRTTLNLIVSTIIPEVAGLLAIVLRGLFGKL